MAPGTSGSFGSDTEAIDLVSCSESDCTFRLPALSDGYTYVVEERVAEATLSGVVADGLPASEGGEEEEEEVSVAASESSGIRTHAAAGE